MPNPEFDLATLADAVDQLPAGVTVFDLEGRMRYYNKNATQFASRNPELIGKDIRDCHKLESSRKRIDAIIEGFKAGSREPFKYVSKPYGEPLSVTVVPFISEGRLIGCIQHVIQKETGIG